MMNFLPFLRILCGIIVLSILFSSKVSAQLPVRADSLFNFIKHNSVHRNKLNWDEEYKSFQACLGKAKSTHDSMYCFAHILEHLDDVHTQIYLGGNYYGHYPELNNDERARFSALMKVAEKHANKPEVRKLDDVIYILVPSFNIKPEEINKYAQLFYDSVAACATSNPSGIILDFRYNTGGNAYPMIAGLGAFLGNEYVVFETGPEGEIVRRWHLEEGNLFINDFQVTQIKTRKLPDMSRVPMVVLTGPVTISSGFVAAVAFRGRVNTILMGEESVSGYTTSNGYFEFPPNLTMNFSTNYIADRDKNIYPQKLTPDLIINQTEDQELINKAKEWLIDEQR